MFAFVLRPAWLTMMILTRRMERSRLAGKLPQSNQPRLSPLTVWVLCFCRHLAITPSLHHSIFFLSPPICLCVYPVGEMCVREDWQQDRRGEVCPALKSRLWPAAEQGLGTWKHWASLPGWHSAQTRVTQQGVCVYICVHMCACVDSDWVSPYGFSCPQGLLAARGCLPLHQRDHLSLHEKQNHPFNL